MSALPTAKTFLQLCQKLRLMAGISGTGPSSVLNNNNNEYARVVEWIRAADLEIQEAYDDWRFMWVNFEFQTVAGQGDYTPAQVAANLAATVRPQRYDQDSFRYWLTSQGSAGEQFMTWRNYPWFRELWRFGTNRTQQGAPQEVTQAPNENLLLAQIPNDIYTITGQFYRKAVALEADLDVPVYPAQYHELPIWWALVKYAGFEEASSVYTHAQNMLNITLSTMERRERPPVDFGSPLA